MSQSFLHRQRKQNLLELCTEAGIPQDEDTRKDDIVEKLHEHLQANATRLSRIPAFESYYGMRRSTPSKARESNAVAIAGATSDDPEVKSVMKARGKKPAKVKEESEESGGALSSPTAAGKAIVATLKSMSPTAVITSTSRTPASRRSQTQLPGPPSPAALANVMEIESTKLSAGMRDLYSISGIPEGIETIRDLCSSVTSIQITFLLLEAVALQQSLIPWRYAFSTPAISAANIPSVAVSLPDVFMLLTGRYWSTTLTWMTTSIFAPVLLAYFYNLTLREAKRGSAHVTVARYAADPLTYNIVKALMAWLVYGRAVTFGVINLFAAERVDAALYGGYQGVLIGSGIGVLAALYEATQRKAA